jgi:hypothetical protein
VNKIGTIEELHAAASDLTGLSDFGPPDYLEGMEVVLASYEQEADLTPDGVRTVRDNLCDILVSRLFSEAGWREYPEHAQIPVERPVFIVGMPRTGTTTLHRLLAADPANQGIELWLTYAPQPRPPASTWPTNLIFQRVQRDIDGFVNQKPGYLGIHNRVADAVEECWRLIRQSMLSSLFEYTGNLPTYSAWMADQDWTGAYRRHRRNLQLIGLRDPERRWVLKCPSHLLCLDALLTTYPDALIIRTHRRPASTVLGSTCSLASRLAPASASFHGEAIGPVALEIAARNLQRFAADRARHDPARFYDVEFADFTADPLAIVADIYRHLRWELPDDVRPAMSAVLAEDARLRAHGYDITDFGVTAEEANARLGALI